MRISIIVPALNEARAIVRTLSALQAARNSGHEVIVVDGGSTDATVALATPFADRIAATDRGRALQMNAGASAATGDLFLFLHADSRLPDDGISALESALRASGRRWGRFDIAIASERWLLRIVAASMNLRSRITGIATGDQGIFVERTLFESIGGFPRQPLMEDIELSRRLKRVAGLPLCLPQRITTSARRWEQHGVWRTIGTMWRWRLAYWRGKDPASFAHRYDDARGAVVLQVFAKSPIRGQVKTRLARTIGDDQAAALYAQLVERTLATARSACAAGIVDRVELWCAPHTAAPGFAAWGERYKCDLRLQTGEDLGARMRFALFSALASGSRALLIGTDCPVLDTAYLASAVGALDNADAVVGPAEDGGYVLIGLRRTVDVFAGIRWSTPDVIGATRSRLRSCGATWEELPTLWDVDEPRDLQRCDALAIEKQNGRVEV